MSARTLSRRIAPARRRELDVATAVAREALLDAHTEYALELIMLARGRVSPARMLEIYVRLHALDPATAAALNTRVLARLARQTEPGGAPPAAAEDATDAATAGEIPAPRHSLLGFARRRLRGRVHHALRRHVELHTGRVEMCLLELHARHALRFVELLGDDVAIADAVEIYCDVAGPRDDLREVLYLRCLDLLSARALPSASARPVLQVHEAEAPAEAETRTVPARRGKKAAG